MKFKKITAFAVSAMLVLSGVAFAENEKKVSGTPIASDTASSDTLFAADGQINVIVDGENLIFDQPPIMESDRVLVPFRAIFEALGCSVDYYNYDGVESVNASMGSKSLYLTIGSTEILVSGETKTTDVAPKIVNDRTLVPIRVVSESFGASVEWDDKTNTVNIASKQGFYKIKREKSTDEYVDENGVKLIDIACYYPVIENADNDEFIASINEDVKNSVAEFVNEVKGKEIIDGAKEYYSYANKGDMPTFSPYTFEFDYDINLNTEDYFSMTAVLYYNLHGAHPMTSMTSVSYDMKAKKEFALTDIWNVDAEGAKKEIIDAFNAEIDKNPTMYFEDAKKTVEENTQRAEFYLDENGVNMYFQLYEIAPYAAGYPMCLIPLEGNEDLYKITLKK